ncbi:MerR family transcriptional regulator [bacterium]|nr:MAG: MerR family transcriptional regulator [bacterium]
MVAKITRKSRTREKLYYSITEVGEITGLKPHILRYWETEFPFLRPKRNRAGNRAYRKKDIEMILLIKRLLYDEGYTIEGAKNKIRQMRKKSHEREAGKKEIVAKQLDVNDLLELLKQIRDELVEIRRLI